MLKSRFGSGFAVTRDVLMRIPLFAVLDDEKYQGLCASCRHRRYERGSLVLDVGQRPDGVYVLLAGTARVVIEDANGRQATLSFLGANEFFGDMGVCDEGEWAAGVRAVTVCETLYVPRRAFAEAIEGSFEAALIVLRGTLARLRKAERKIAGLALLDVYARVARLFIEQAEEIDGEWIVAVGAEEIARSVAASREMVSRVVNKMMTNGLVRRDRRRTVILDRTLMAIAIDAARG